MTCIQSKLQKGRFEVDRLYNKGIDHVTNKGILKGWITAKNKRLLVIFKKN